MGWWTDTEERRRCREVNRKSVRQQQKEGIYSLFTAGRGRKEVLAEARRKWRRHLALGRDANRRWKQKRGGARRRLHAKAEYLYNVEGGVRPYISVLSFNVTAAVCRDSARSLLINTRLSFMILSRYV